MKKIYTPSIITGITKKAIRKGIYFFLLQLLIVPGAFAQVTNTESFEGAFFPSAGWSVYGSSSYLYKTGYGANPTQSPYSGSGELEWNSYNLMSGGTAGLVTPMIDWSGRGTNTPTVSFWFYRDATSYDYSSYDGEGVNVWVNTGSYLGGTQLGYVPRRGGESANGAYLVLGATYTTTVSGWYQYTFDIPAGFNTSTNYIIFDFVSKYGDNTFMDDVQYISYPNTNISFSLNTDTTCSGHPLTITNTSTDPSATSYFWNFGDGYTLNTTTLTPFSHTYNYQGIYNITMSAYDAGSANIGGSFQTVNILQGSSGYFYMSRDSICPGEQVNFDPGMNYNFIKWYVSDGYTSTNYYANRTFPTLGNYTINCIVNTACGVDTIKRVLKVANTFYANASFNVNTVPSCPNKDISFYPSDYSGNHLWNFGDGNTSAITSPYHKYNASGTYTVTHTLTNSCGNPSVQSMIVSIVDTLYPTYASFGYSPNMPQCPGIQISFNSYNNEGQWSWNFGDGKTATGQYPKHTYTAPGTYTVTHTITNGCGNSFSQTDLVFVSGSQRPDSSFNYPYYPFCPKDLVNFSPYEQNAKTYLWDFGDGVTSSVQSPSHSYSAPGSYSVTLTVKNFCNIQSTAVNVVNVTGSMSLNIWSSISAYPSPACPTEPVNFSISAWGFPTYVWNFGDGAMDSSSSANAMHSYTTAGTYTASVRIYNNCGNDTILYLPVEIKSSMMLSYVNLNSYPSVVCPGQAVNINAPWGYPTYIWNMGDGSPQFTSGNSYVNYNYSATGIYVASVKIVNYCGIDTTLYDTIRVNNNTNFCSSCMVNSWATWNACPNQSVNFNTDFGYAWYKWDFGDGSSVTATTSNTTHSYTATGTYNYTLTITNFCGVDTVLYNSILIDNTVQVPNWLWFNINPNVVCPGQEVHYNTDNSYSSYLWDFGDGVSANGTGNAAHTYTATGAYNVSVVVGNSCGNTATIQGSVSVDSSASFPSWINMWANDPSCPNSPVTLSTYAGYSSYLWDFGDGTQLATSTEQATHIYAATGHYPASVTITNSCGNSVTVYKNIDINNSVTINWLDIYVPNNPACAGDVVMLNVNSGAMGGGGGNNYTYSWDYGDGSPLDTTIGTGASHTYTANGVYNVVLTAVNACGKTKTASKLVTINSSSSPQVNSWSFGIMPNNSPTSTVCPGDLLVFYFEGVNSNNSWNFGDGDTAVATDVFVRTDGVTITTIKHAYATVGTHNYSLSLGNGCGNNTQQSKAVTVSNNLLVSGGFMISPPSGTLGYTTCGQIDFLAVGGHNYDWDFGDSTTLSTLSPTVVHSYANPGNYNVKVTITNGCGNSASYVQTITINGVGGTNVSASSTISPTCNGGSNGSASVTITGGEAPYTYAWSDDLGQTVSSAVSASNLSAGTYVVTVTDNSGCAGNTTVILNDPAALAFSISSTPASCGGSNGTASVASVTGGTSPYYYSWSNGETTSTASGFSMGTYAISVSDANGCSSSSNASISESGATVTVTSVTNATCNGSSNGAANISVAGGTAPYTYAWSNGATTQNISGIAAGNYSVVVTDNGGCQSTNNTTVSQPSLIVVNVTPVVSPTCGNFNGKAIANVSGGTASYTYLWPSAGNQTTQTATGLPAGTYSVQVTDAIGCTKNGVITLSNANAPVLSTVITNVSCNGAGDGSIDLTVTGGTSPYLYTWNIGAPQTNNQDVTGLVQGSYLVIINDAAGCMSVGSYSITQPSVLTASITNTGATCGNSDGTATALPSGGNTPYSYAWSTGL
ncbi:MAG: PKD domain-containing protein, partial [Bacteroidetes bacterium]|nr:PKD domain-containing protein [Bacteroidota bacterium]